MFRIIFLLGIFFAARNASCSEIEKIVAYVGDNPCDDCKVYATVCGPDGSTCCNAGHLDNPNVDDMEVGQVDEFYGSMIHDCDEFEIPNGDVFKLVIDHSGSDGVTVNVWKVQFGDGKKVFCEDTYFIDNSEQHTLYCN